MVLFFGWNHSSDYCHFVMYMFILEFVCDRWMNYLSQLKALDEEANLVSYIYMYFFFDRCCLVLCLSLSNQFQMSLNELQKLNWNNLFEALLFKYLLLQKILIIYHLIKFSTNLQEIRLIFLLYWNYFLPIYALFSKYFWTINYFLLLNYNWLVFICILNHYNSL